MPIFDYKAITMDGRKSSGRIEAASADQLALTLRGYDLFMVEARQRDTPRFAQQKLKTIEVADFCRQLSAMLGSGITLIRAMMILSQRDIPPNIRRIYTSLIEDLQRGSTLSEAMAMRGRAFPELLINMIHAGEQTGRLDVTTQKMADAYDKEHRLAQKLKSATTYPFILVVLIIAVVIIIFTYVVPKFTALFGDMPLPLPTRIVMSMSDFLLANGVYLAVCAVIAAFAVAAVFRKPGPRRSLDRFKLRIPKIGKLLSTIYTGRFARTLASLYVSGIPMIQALNVSRETIGNKYVESQFARVLDALGNGRTLSQAIAEVVGFEPKLRSTILIGEESGRLEHMLESIADQYDYDSEMASQRMVALIEPVLIVVMAGVVVMVIVSVMLPIFQLYSNIGSQGGI